MPDEPTPSPSPVPANLPPLVPMPDSTAIPPELMGQLEHAAQWAGTFGGSDTNLVQRYRHNQDVTDYANALAQQRTAAQAHLLQTDKNAQNFYFDSLKLDLAQKEAQMRMQHANEMAPLNVAAKTAQIQAEQALEKARTQTSLLQAQHDQRQADDTLGLTQHMGEILARSAPGTEDYNAGVLQGIVTFPNADKNVQANLLKNAGVQMSPDEFIAQAMKAKQSAAAAGLQSPRVISYQGRPLVVEGAAPKLEDPQIRKNHLESLWAKAKDDDVKAYFQRQIEFANREIAQKTAHAPPSSAATPPTPSPPSADAYIKGLLGK